MSTHRYLPLTPTQAMLDAPLPEGSSVATARHESRRDLRPLIWAAMVGAAPWPAGQPATPSPDLPARLAELDARATPGDWEVRGEGRCIVAASTNPHIGGRDAVLSTAYSDRDSLEDDANLRLAAELVTAYRAGQLVQAPRPAGVVAGPPDLGRANYALGRLASLASIAHDDLYGDMEPDEGSTMLAGWVDDVRAALEPRQDNPAPVQPLIPHPLQSGFLRPASVVLSDLAAQEGCDGEPYDTMQRVAEALRKESDQ